MGYADTRAAHTRTPSFPLDQTYAKRVRIRIEKRSSPLSKPQTHSITPTRTPTMIAKNPTLLEQLENSGVGVDVDAGDPEVAKSLPFKPHDMTSNQILVHERIMAPENKELVEKTIREMKGADWKDIHIVLVRLRPSTITSALSLHCLRSAARADSPRPPDSTPWSFLISKAEFSLKFPLQTRTTREKSSNMPESTGMHTTRKVSQSEQHVFRFGHRSYCGIFDEWTEADSTSDRFCIKIPTTTAGVQAAAELYKEGIRTLGTALFSLHQALAAAQGMMLSISPYFNGKPGSSPDL